MGSTPTHAIFCGIDVVVTCQPSKLNSRVQVSYPVLRYSLVGENICLIHRRAKVQILLPQLRSAWNQSGDGACLKNKRGGFDSHGRHFIPR